MGLFENLDKLVTEHGSAQILRERLLLADEKYNKVEQERNSLATENQSLKDEIESLKARLESYETGALLEIEEEILIAAAKIQGYAPPSDFARALSLSQTKAEYYVQNLVEKEFLESPMVIVHSHPGYKLSQLGKRYLIEKNLID